MHRLVAERGPIDQTARIRSIIGVALNYLTVENAGEHPVKGQPVCLSFFIGVVGNPYPIMANSLGNVLYIHV